MRRLLFLSLVLLSSSNALADEMRIYGFTSNFVDCVKSHTNEKDQFTRAGNSESGLMNGREDLAGGELGSSYWSYMSCLNNADSGTVNKKLSVSKTCEKVELDTSYGYFYLPPGVEGKKIGRAGYYWGCSSGSWSKVSGDVVNPGGVNIPEPAIKNKSCNQKEINISSCKFNLSSTKNGQTSEDAYGPLWGDESSSVEGSILASCNNGSFTVVSSSCKQVNCQEGETVTWSGVNSVGAGAFCSGEVNYAGEAQHRKVERRYFASETLAIIGTRIIDGSSSFVCHDGEWVNKGDVNSTCSVKIRDDLDCHSKDNGLTKEYYCE